MDDPTLVHQRRDDYQIVDVREPYEWNAGHIAEAEHVPLANLMAGQGIDRLQKDRPVVVVCRTGNRSELGSVMLRARGYDAHNLEGGMERWAAAGLPFEASDGGPGTVA
jgi:rhodanese-related sulfurtransferase